MSVFYRCDICGTEYEPDNVSKEHKYGIIKIRQWPTIELHMCDECLTKLNSTVDQKFEKCINMKTLYFDKIIHEVCPSWALTQEYSDEQRTDAVLKYIAEIKKERAFYFKTLNWVVPSLLIIILALGVKLFV